MMRYKIKEASREPVTEDRCRHYWLIEGANGPTSRGVCKFCGAQKEFYNSWSGFTTAVKQDTRILELPELPDIEPDGESDELELEESGASL